MDFVIPKGDKGDEGECLCCVCFEQLKNIIDQLIKLYPATTAVVNMSAGGNISGRLSNLYPTTDTAGLLSLKNAAGQLTGAVSLCKIASIKLTGATYNNSIIYLDEPIDLIETCDTDCEKAIRQALPVGTQKVNITAGGQSIGSGEILKNEFGMLVLADNAGLNPTFAVTCNISSISEIV